MGIWFAYQLTHAKIGYMDNRGGNIALLAAEFQKAEEVCNIDIYDSTEISIRVGRVDRVKWIKRTYAVHGDTLEIKGDISELKPYINTPKLLVKNGKLFFHLSPDQQYSNYYAATIWLNRINPGK